MVGGVVAASTEKVVIVVGGGVGGGSELVCVVTKKSALTGEEVRGVFGGGGVECGIASVSDQTLMLSERIGQLEGREAVPESRSSTDGNLSAMVNVCRGLSVDGCAGRS